MNRFRCVILGATLLLVVAGNVHAGSLLFRELSSDHKDGSWGSKDEIPGWDHVGFEDSGWVWESHPGYPPRYTIPFSPSLPIYHDPLIGQNVQVPQVFGVQNLHTKGSFLHDAPRPGATDVTSTAVIDISPGLAAGMAAQAMLVRGSPFNLIDFSGLDGIASTLAPSVQKGGTGKFTCVGLVEYCAEQAGHNGGQGFVPDFLESFTVNGKTIPMLSPQLLYWAASAQDRIRRATNWLQTLFDPVDFILTDPMGRRIGHTAQTGTLTEIPGAFFSGNGNLEQLVILDPLPGEYILTLVDTGNPAAVALSTSTGADYYFDGTVGASPVQTAFQVPEPFALCPVLLAAATLGRQQQRGRR